MFPNFLSCSTTLRQFVCTSLLLTIALRFTFGERKNCSTIKKSQNVINMIVAIVFKRTLKGSKLYQLDILGYSLISRILWHWESPLPLKNQECDILYSLVSCHQTFSLQLYTQLFQRSLLLFLGKNSSRKISTKDELIVSIKSWEIYKQSNKAVAYQTARPEDTIKCAKYKESWTCFV